ncbi:MAG: hypothetical protein QF619_10635 [Candidatus Binatia bacterium]|nr:hypothetical protein [Candidatus Binatia bacterium]
MIPLLKAYRGEILRGLGGERVMRGKAKTAILEDGSREEILPATMISGESFPLKQCS